MSQTVGVAYDGGADAAAALAVARELAAPHRARLLALTVFAPVPGAVRRVRILEQAARDSLRQLEGVEGRVAVGAPRPTSWSLSETSSTRSSWGHAAADRSGA